ncbi:MAG TPA: PAS domain-containing protein, partial [Isosphaeraceae bacterium]|nr:PAS domain-containing protein [Isosphaeraceae bacterium]
MSQAHAMIDSLRAVTAVATAEIDLSGLLVDANAGFLRLLPAGGRSAPGIAVAPSLISPSFARLIELSGSGAETLYEGLMTLGDPIGKSRSLHGSVSRTERGLLLFLEYDVEELSHVAETALELSSELAQAQRELLSSNNRLRLKEAERAQSEQRLRRSESLLAEAQCLAKLGSWNWDILSDQILWSDEHYRIFGLNPRESGMTFERFLRLVHPDDRETVRSNVELALQEGQPYDCTMRAVHPDGTVRIVLSRAQVVRDEGGKTIRMFGTVQD